MSESSSDGSRVNWFGIIGILVGLGGQGLWFSTQFGALNASREAFDHRLTAIEQGGSPALQALRAQIEINTKKLASLDRTLPDQLTRLAVADEAHRSQLAFLAQRTARLDDDLREHERNDVSVAVRLAALEGQARACQALAIQHTQ